MRSQAYERDMKYNKAVRPQVTDYQGIGANSRDLRLEGKGKLPSAFIYFI